MMNMMTGAVAINGGVGVMEIQQPQVAASAAQAENVEYGYLPDIDETLETKTGICFDYAALMCAMLRCRGIPAKLDIGYTNDGMYHAWISTYLKDKGWVDNIIEFDGDTWQFMDPTMTAASSTEAEKKQVSKDTQNYMVNYVR